MVFWFTFLKAYWSTSITYSLLLTSILFFTFKSSNLKLFYFTESWIISSVLSELSSSYFETVSMTWFISIYVLNYVSILLRLNVYCKLSSGLLIFYKISLIFLHSLAISWNFYILSFCFAYSTWIASYTIIDYFFFIS